METDLRFRRSRRRGHELADGIENRFELGIVFLLQVSQFASQLGVGQEHFPEPHERAHNGDVDLHARRLRKTLESIATPCSVKA